MVHVLLMVSVDQVSYVVVSLGDARWLELAAADTTKGKPGEDAKMWLLMPQCFIKCMIVLSVSASIIS